MEAVYTSPLGYNPRAEAMYVRTIVYRIPWPCAHYSGSCSEIRSCVDKVMVS